MSPGYDLAGSDLTGRAVFTKGAERLEVYTANRRSLEHVFGVDLIYLNVTRQNIVMLQYKILEPKRKGAGEDWIYRPDDQLDTEIERMKKFLLVCLYITLKILLPILPPKRTNSRTLRRTR